MAMMTLEDRVAFLRQSIESHDRQIAALTDSIAKRVDLDRTEERADRIAITTPVNFDRLTQAIRDLDKHADKSRASD